MWCFSLFLISFINFRVLVLVVVGNHFVPELPVSLYYQKLCNLHQYVKIRMSNGSTSQCKPSENQIHLSTII